MSEKDLCNNEPWSRYAKHYDPIKIGSIDGTDTEPHDKAIVRAIESDYRPNKHVKGKANCTIFVSRLNPKTTKDTIKDVFSKFGRLKRFRLVKDIVTGFPKGYAFIEYESENSAEDAYRKAYKMNIDGHTIFVDFECERLLKGWKPRRLGGGFGGKKESGQLRFGCRDRPFRKPISLEMKEQEKKEGEHKISKDSGRNIVDESRHRKRYDRDHEMHKRRASSEQEHHDKEKNGKASEQIDKNPDMQSRKNEHLSKQKNSVDNRNTKRSRSKD